MFLMTLHEFYIRDTFWFFLFIFLLGHRFFTRIFLYFMYFFLKAMKLLIQILRKSNFLRPGFNGIDGDINLMILSLMFQNPGIKFLKGVICFLMRTDLWSLLKIDDIQLSMFPKFDGWFFIMFNSWSWSCSWFNSFRTIDSSTL